MACLINDKGEEKKGGMGLDVWSNSQPQLDQLLHQYLVLPALLW
jgi:hypothetical protein